MAETVKDSFEELLELYPIDFVIPQRVNEELQRKGIAATVRGDSREWPRFRTSGPAILSWLSSPVAVIKPQPTRQVIVRDLSKTGVGFLTSSEWYPEQVGKLEFAVGALTIKVMRSRRVGSRCYEIGARILKFSGGLEG
jgi:hypothetical protein